MRDTALDIKIHQIISNEYIRKLDKKDHDQVFPFLHKDSSKNLFIIGDIEAYGYEQDFQELWGNFDIDGNILAILLRYHDSFVLYGQESYNSKGIASILKCHKHSTVSGDSKVLAKLDYYLPKEKYLKTKNYFSECT